MADVDLSEFFKTGSVADLDWLDVDEEEYRKLDRLPKQNLDIAPDLDALWSHEDKPSTAYLDKDLPNTMGDLSQLHGPIDMSEDLIKTARLAVMQTTDPQKIRAIIAARYDKGLIKAAKTALAEVFAERGLLGKFYLNASDFPTCNRGSKKASDFVRKYATEARFVVQKEACGDCQHRQALSNGTNHCAVFHKQLQLNVPYTDALASEVEHLQIARGKVVQASTTNPKERIRLALLATEAKEESKFTGRTQVAPKQAAIDVEAQLISISNLTKKRDAEIQQKLAVEKARPVVALLRREMLKGRSEYELLHTLKLAFEVRDLRATRSEWEPLFKEAGLYGAIYSTQDSFDDCREGADFLNKHASKARAIVAGQKCESCIFNKVGRCMMYGRKLVASAEDIYTSETVRAVVDEHKIAGNLPYIADKIAWGETPAQALKAIHKAASGPHATPQQMNLRETTELAFSGHSKTHTANTFVRRDIVKAAARYLNEGLYGSDLLAALKSQFDPRDLRASTTELKKVLAEQGLQGIKYIDPSIYGDYGKGCHEAQRLHRSRQAVKYAKIGSKCGSCVHQTRAGYCSVLNKQLVVEPPYLDKFAEQQAMLNSGVSTEISAASLINSGLSMMQEYELQHREASLELNPTASDIDLSVEFGIQDIKL